jgi:branched-chain amino acid transport system substrate-binding protein
MLQRVLLSTVLLLSLLLAACGGRNGEPTQGDVIVYVALPLSGPQANGGQTALGGARLAAAEINRTGGLLGYKVIIRELDDESNSEVAVAKAQQVVAAVQSGERVLAVIGHMNSGQTLAALDLYKDLPIVVITPTASEESLTKRGFANFFRANANDGVQGVVDAEFLVSQLKAQQVAVIYNNTIYGKGLAASLVKELEARGAGASLQLEFPEGQRQFEKEVAAVKSSQVDAIFFAGYETEAPNLRADLVEAGITLPMLASDGAFVATTIDEANGTAEGMYVSGFAPSPRNVADAQWIEAYQAVEFRNPDNFSVNGYVAMQVLAEGVRQAGELDAGKIAGVLRGGTVETLLGSLQYTEQGDLAEPKIWVYQVKDGEFQQVQ